MRFLKFFWNWPLPVIGFVSLFGGWWFWYNDDLTFPWEYSSFETTWDKREDQRITSPDGKYQVVLAEKLADGQHFSYGLYIVDTGAKLDEYSINAFSIFGWPSYEETTFTWRELIALDIVNVEWRANDLVQVTYCAVPTNGWNYAPNNGQNPPLVDLNIIRRDDCKFTIRDEAGFYPLRVERN